MISWLDGAEKIVLVSLSYADPPILMIGFWP